VVLDLIFRKKSIAGTGKLKVPIVNIFEDLRKEMFICSTEDRINIKRIKKLVKLRFLWISLLGSRLDLDPGFDFEFSTHEE